MFKWRHLIAVAGVTLGLLLTGGITASADQLFTTSQTETHTQPLWVNGEQAVDVSWNTPLFTNEDVGKLDMGDAALRAEVVSKSNFALNGRVAGEANWHPGTITGPNHEQYDGYVLFKSSRDLTTAATTMLYVRFGQGANSAYNMQFAVLFVNGTNANQTESWYSNSSLWVGIQHTDTPAPSQLEPPHVLPADPIATPEVLPADAIQIPDVGLIAPPSGTDTGDISAPTGTDTGDISAPSGVDTGDISAPTGTDTGDISAPTGTDTGDISAPSGTDTGDISAPSTPDTGDITVNGQTDGSQPDTQPAASLPKQADDQETDATQQPPVTDSDGDDAKVGPTTDNETTVGPEQPVAQTDDKSETAQSGDSIPVADETAQSLGTDTPATTVTDALSNQAATLPETGMKRQSILTVVGLGMLISLAGMILFKKIR
ncbi:LPXTG cell wall anchor domain-containing protein [Weissella cibaria]|uniref:LPXTG cell wall anchor domain-containing protein n=1 Tax=Weissella cibaria TaxID=137591 RepID=UPI002A759EFB|nr:LPXTG cell wall anchor domain-containing protein [Weissella cibaria]MDY2519827.1 LPXTG cell wall anchor domain-containing protein [Weissella cibaria]